MIIHRMRSLAEWHDYTTRFNRSLDEQISIENGLIAVAQRQARKSVTVPGYSYTAQKPVNFEAAVNPDGINWRESLVCPDTHLINRIRFCMQIFDIECRPHPDDQLYVMEQLTPLYNFLSSRYINIIGSEFLGAGHTPGQIDRGIRHEDMTRLSFMNNSLNHIHSYEVLEHVPEYRRGIVECYRVLSPGGTMLITTPFIPNRESTTVRASMGADGVITHLLPPEYHGDPVSSNGVLCYYHFGWDLIATIRDCGFSDAYVCSSWSRQFGYLGCFANQVIVARK